MRSRRKARKSVVTACGFVVEGLEVRQLLTGTGLIDAVYHGINGSVFGGGNGNIVTMVNAAATTTPNYRFTNTGDTFIYAGDSGASTPTFLGADAAGAALSDTSNVGDTIFDAEGYFQTPTANDTGTYTLTLPPTGGNGGADDLVAVYVGGNGTPGSGTLVGSSGWQGANAGLPNFQFTVPAAPNASVPANIPIEIIWGNGNGGAFLNAVAGSSPATAVMITDPNGAQITTYNTTLGTGLTDNVYHNINGSDFGGGNGNIAALVNDAATATPNDTFTNTADTFIYAGGSGASTTNFLEADAAGAALSDNNGVGDTIVDAEGYFQTPTANDAGTYTLTLPPTGGAGNSVDDLVAVYVNGNGTPGSGTLVGSSGWQGANAGLPNFQFTVPASPPSTAPANIPIEVIWGNGNGGAYLSAVSGSSPATGVMITDPNSVQITTYNTTAATAATNEPAPVAPTVGTPTVGSQSVLLTWNSSLFAASYSVWRYVTSAGPLTAQAIKTGITGTGALSFTDSPTTDGGNAPVNGTQYTYYITAVNESGSTQSNTETATPEPAPTAAVTDLTASRTNSTTVQLSWTAPPLGTNYTITRSTTPGGTQTLLTSADGQTPTTFTDTTADDAGDTDYYYTVTSVAPDGTEPSPSVQVFVGHGDGWSADYYTDNIPDPTGTAVEKPLTGDADNADLAFERIDPTVSVLSNTPPGWNAFQTSLGNSATNDFAVRWVGYVEAPITGYYSLGVQNADDKEEITVYDPNDLTNGQPTPVNISPAGYVMTGFGGSYTDPVVTTGGTPYQFTAGQEYLVQVDYNQGNGGYNANLYWAASSTAANATAGTYDTMPLEVVPTDDVVPTTPAFATVDASGAVTKDSNSDQTLDYPNTPDSEDYYSFAPTSQGDGIVTLQWDSVAADSYNLYRSTSQNGPYTQINTSPIPAASNGAPVTYTDTYDLTDGTPYYYILTGVDQSGETSVNLSTGATSGLTTSATPQAVAPAVPTDVTAAMTDSTTTGIQGEVNFPAVQNATSYTVQRSTSATGTFTTVGNSSTNPGEFTTTGSTVLFTDSDPSLTANTHYYYQVIADGPSTASAPSTPVETNIAGPALATAGTVEVDVIADAGGTPAPSTIPDFGNQGGIFNTGGTDAVANSSVADRNSVSYDAYQFDGTNYATSTGSFNSPSDLTGNSTRSIEVWVDNPTIDNGEESLVSWAHRGGPNGTNESLSYGSAYAVGQWGGTGYDLQWNNTAPGVTGTGAPVANAWHYLVFTYDGTNNDVYVDGKLYLQQAVGMGGLSTFAGFPVNLAAQNGSAIASDFASASVGSVDLASVRIESGALTAAQVATNYTIGVQGQYTLAAPTGVTAAMVDTSTLGVQGEVSFPAIIGATSYTVQRSTSGSSGTFVTVGNSSANPGEFTTTGSTVLFTDSDPTLNATSRYYYQAIAIGQTTSPASTPVETNIAGPALATAGTVEVDVIAAAGGTPAASTIPDFGNQGGIFTTGGGAVTNGPVADANSASFDAYQFNGTSYATSQGSFVSPTDLNGNSSRSIEVWVNDPSITAAEETMVSWSHRGGNPDGSNLSFSYGNQYAVGLWGGEYDETWGNNLAPGAATTGVPTADNWHDLVFTYDGANDDVYVDGQLAITRPVANGGLGTFAGFPINLAASNAANVAGTFQAFSQGAMDLASVRIESGALTAAQVQYNYDIGVQGQYSSGPAVSSITPTTGPAAGGITVTINGSGFNGATGVTFGGVAATGVTVVPGSGGTQVTAVDPAGTGTVDVQVIAPNASNFNATSLVSPADQFTYAAAPVVTGVTDTTYGSGTGPAAGGTTVTITGSNFTSATGVTFVGSPSVTPLSVTATQITVVDPAGTGTVDVEVTTPNGTSTANPPADQFTYVAAPAVTGVNVNGGAATGPAAGGTTVTITGTGFTGATGVTFVGSPSVTPLTVTATQVTVVDPAGSGTVDVEVTTPVGGTSAANPPADQFTYTSVAAPTVVSVTPEDENGNGVVAGSSASGQRSMITQIVVVFNEPVQSLTSSAFTLGLVNNYGSGSDSGASPVIGADTDISGSLGTPVTTDGGTTWVVPIVANGTYSYGLQNPGAEYSATPTATSPAGVFASLANGVYHLGVVATAVTAVGGPSMASNYTSDLFHRLYGDMTNSETLNTTDVKDFGKFYAGTASAAITTDMDYVGSGVSNTADVKDFGKAYVITYTYTPGT